MLLELSKIRENSNALRAVNRKSEEYQELVDSIISRGILNPISVREQKDPNTGELYYGLIDGLHRYTASKDAGLTEIPVYVKNMDDGAVEEAQIIANVHKIETKPVEYSKQIHRILARNPLMTISELSRMLTKSPSWVTERLGLLKLAASVQQLVDEGVIGLSNAYALKNLPEEEQVQYLQQAQTESPSEFCPKINDRVSELRAAKRKGKDAEPVQFQPTAFLQRLGDIKDEHASPSIGTTLLSRFSVSDPVAAWSMAIAWVLHLDPESQQAQHLKDQQRKDKLAAEKAARKKERDEVKAKEAAEKQAAAEEAVA